MIKGLRTLASFATIALMATSAYCFNFTADSPLSTGKWVKIKVSEEGLYRITNQQLKELGFADPSKVGVYGNGGTVYPINFVGNIYNPAVYSDKIEQLATVHDSEGVVFYGLGATGASYNPTLGGFEKGWKNIYTNSGYYYLSDSQAVKEATVTPWDSLAEQLTQGVGYVYHENDLSQNENGYGQLFWGENLLENEVNLSRTDRFLGEGAGFVYAGIFGERKMSGDVQVKHGDNLIPKPFTVGAGAVLTAMKINFPLEFNNSNPLSVSLKCSETTGEFCYLDYAVMNYPKRVPAEGELRANECELITFPTKSGVNYKMHADNSVLVLDVTDPNNMTICGRGTDNTSMVAIDAADRYCKIVMTNGGYKEIDIKDCEPVDNVNLHALAADKVDYVIISVPRFKIYAEEIAEIHRSLDGMNVVVVTPQDLYNEFTAGIPSPMAYRAFAKMLYQNGNALKHMLLFGPVLGDFRKEMPQETVYDRIISFGERDLRSDREPATVLDFYGMMNDQIEEATLYRQDMQVSVGMLAPKNETECRRIVRKIKEYSTDQNIAWWGNEYLIIGGIGDVHTHDNQAVGFTNQIHNTSGGVGIATNLSADAYGATKACSLMKSHWDAGKVMSVYFGHGGPRTFGKNDNFFNTSDAMMLRNKHLSILFMGGCDFSLPEKRVRGLGEILVLEADRGMVGTICTNRTTWSNQNGEFAERMLGKLNAQSLTSGVTLGQIYSSSKSRASYANTLAYFLVGDPALRIPVVTRNVELEKVPESIISGSRIRLKGVIKTKKGELEPNYSGKIVAKLFKPERIEISNDYETATLSGKDRDTLRIPYRTDRVLAMEGKVVNGKFDFEVTVPNSVRGYEVGEKFSLVLTAADCEKRELAAQYLKIPYALVPENSIDNQVVMDNQVPSVALEYLAERGQLAVDINDDGGIHLDGSTVVLKIDGKKVKFHVVDKAIYGESGHNMRLVADMKEMTIGRHDVKVDATDLAGNKGEYMLSFDKYADNYTLRVALENKVATDRLAYSVAGDTNGSLTAVIEDTKGIEVMTLPAISADGEIALADKDGKPLADGLYRFRVFDTSRSDDSRHSAWVNFAVMK